MSKNKKNTIIIGVLLISLSIILHYAHYLIFRDLHHTLIFLFADIAFIPMEVFFTTLIIDKHLINREHIYLKERVNMLIGIFYTEIGTSLLSSIIVGDDYIKDFTEDTLDVISFDKLNKDILTHKYIVDIYKIDLNLIKEIINNNKDLLLTLSTNSCIIENEDFAKMLMSILHLKEELATRYNVKMEDYELQHFKSDIETCYRLLTLEWVQYMKFLSNKYPFLFTKALINNPFDTRCKKEKDTVYLN